MTTEIHLPPPLGMFFRFSGGQLVPRTDNLPNPEVGQCITRFADEIKQSLEQAQAGGAACDVDCLLVFHPKPGQLGQLVQTPEEAHAILTQVICSLPKEFQRFPREQDGSDGIVVRISFTFPEGAGNQSLPGAPIQAGPSHRAAILAGDVSQAGQATYTPTYTPSFQP